MLHNGDSITVPGSKGASYVIKKVGGVVFCACIAWKQMGGSNEDRVCKHIRAYVDPRCLPRAALLRAGMIVAETKPAAVGEGKVGSVSGFMDKLKEREKAELEADRSLSAKIAKVFPPKKIPALPPKKIPALLLAMKWTNQNPTRWWMSEKMDGVRALWDGSKFVSKEGNEFVAPPEFRKGLPPNVNLDGELWFARGGFQTALSYVRKSEPDSTEWDRLTFVVFDAPNAFGTFEIRQEYLQKLHKGRPSTRWKVLEQERCHSPQHLTWFHEGVVALKGEGVMLREFGSSYVVGESGTLLKVKNFFDEEATVIDYVGGRGKNKGRLGALVCRMANGTEFNVGTGFSDRDRENPPPKGSRITYKYVGLTDGGKPRHASFVAVRDYE